MSKRTRDEHRTHPTTTPHPPAVHEFKLSDLKVYTPTQALKMNIGDADLTFGELPDPQ